MAMAHYRKLAAMTLTEVMVAIAIVLITMQGFTYLFLKTWDTNKFILEEGMASADASRATNKIIIQLRVTSMMTALWKKFTISLISPQTSSSSA